MGICKAHLTFRFSEETLAQLDAIKEVFTPFAEDRSSALRIIIHILHSLLFMPAKLEHVIVLCQKLQEATKSHDQLVFRFPSNEPSKANFRGRVAQ